MKIYLTGSDGSGKSTHLKRIEDYLHKRGLSTSTIWIRSPKILSKPLMLICRSLGYTKYRTIDGIRYGEHEFYRSALLSKLYPFLQLIDFRLKWWWMKARVPHSDVLLYDRFALDTLADLMVDTRRFNLHKTRIGKSFVKYINGAIKTIVLHLDAEEIRKRKSDTLHDYHLHNKVEVYKILADDLKLIQIENQEGIEKVSENILKALNIDAIL